MRKNARIIITKNCNRKCFGCCNEQNRLLPQLDDLEKLGEYKEFILTGGEPFTIGEENLLEIINTLKKFNVPLVIYSSWYSKNKELYQVILNTIDKLTFTLHFEANQTDLEDLYELTKVLPEKLSSRLYIDSRLFEKMDIDLKFLESKWSRFKKLEWKEKCPVPENEDLFYIDFKRILEFGREA